MAANKSGVTALYNELTSKGYKLGSKEQFMERMGDDNRRLAFYDMATSRGIDLGSYVEFRQQVAAPEPPKTLSGKIGSAIAGIRDYLPTEAPAPAPSTAPASAPVQPQQRAQAQQQQQAPARPQDNAGQTPAPATTQQQQAPAQTASPSEWRRSASMDVQDRAREAQAQVQAAAQPDADRRTKDVDLKTTLSKDGSVAKGFEKMQKDWAFRRMVLDPMKESGAQPKETPQFVKDLQSMGLLPPDGSKATPLPRNKYEAEYATNRFLSQKPDNVDERTYTDAVALMTNQGRQQQALGEVTDVFDKAWDAQMRRVGERPGRFMVGNYNNWAARAYDLATFKGEFYQRLSPRTRAAFAAAKQADPNFDIDTYVENAFHQRAFAAAKNDLDGWSWWHSFGGATLAGQLGSGWAESEGSGMNYVYAAQQDFAKSHPFWAGTAAGVGFAADMLATRNLFGISKLAGAGAASAMTRAGAKPFLTRVVSGAASSGALLGTYDMASTAAYQLGKGEFDAGEILTQGAHGLKAGATLGVFGQMVAPWAGRVGRSVERGMTRAEGASRFADRAAQFAGKAAELGIDKTVEVGAFSLWDIVDGKNVWETLGQNGVMVLSMGVGTPHNYKALAPKRLRQFFTPRNPGYGDVLRRWEGARGDGWFSVQDKALLRRHGYGEVLTAEPKKWERVDELLADERLPEYLRNKIEAMGTGQMRPTSVVVGTHIKQEAADRWVVAGVAEDGHEVVRMEFNSPMAAERARGEMDKAAEQGRYLDAEAQLSNSLGTVTNTLMGRTLREVGEEYGIDMEEVAKVKPKERTEEEKKAVEEYQRRLGELNISKELGLQSGKDIADKVGEEYGLDIAKVAKKPKSKRTDLENDAMEEYRRRLIEEKNRADAAYEELNYKPVIEGTKEAAVRTTDELELSQWVAVDDIMDEAAKQWGLEGLADMSRDDLEDAAHQAHRDYLQAVRRHGAESDAAQDYKRKAMAAARYLAFKEAGDKRLEAEYADADSYLAERKQEQEQRRHKDGHYYMAHKAGDKEGQLMVVTSGDFEVGADGMPKAKAGTTYTYIDTEGNAQMVDGKDFDKVYNSDEVEARQEQYDNNAYHTARRAARNAIYGTLEIGVGDSFATQGQPDAEGNPQETEWFVQEVKDGKVRLTASDGREMVRDLEELRKVLADGRAETRRAYAEAKAKAEAEEKAKAEAAAKAEEEGATEQPANEGGAPAPTATGQPAAVEAEATTEQPAIETQGPALPANHVPGTPAEWKEGVEIGYKFEDGTVGRATVTGIGKITSEGFVEDPAGNIIEFVVEGEVHPRHVNKRDAERDIASHYEQPKQEAEPATPTADAEATPPPAPAPTTEMPVTTTEMPVTTTETPAPPAPPTADSQEQQQEQPSAMQQMPRNRAGKIDWEAVPADVSLAALLESTKGDKAKAKAIITSMIERRKKECEDAEKLEMKGADPEEMIASTEANSEAVAKTKTRYEHWLKMAEMLDGKKEEQPVVEQPATPAAEAPKVEAPKTEAETPAPAPAPAVAVNTPAPAAPAPAPSVEAPKQTALQRIRKDKDDNPLYEEEAPDLAWDALVEDLGGDETAARSQVVTNIAEYDKALKKVEKAIDKPKGKTPNERLKNQKASIAERERLKKAIAAWEEIGKVQGKRKTAQIEAEVAQQEEQQRQQAANGQPAVGTVDINTVPEMHNESAEESRKRGVRRFDGKLYYRQPDNILETAVVGKEIEVQFSWNDTPKGRLAVVEAEMIQPSHIAGARNPMFFITEAQPKDRTDAESVVRAQNEIARKNNPSRSCAIDGNAYSGPSTINRRGEVIQGNNRADGLRYLWENNLPEQQERYRQYLIDNAEKFGLDSEALAKVKHPVLVRVLDVDDAEAIRLGQFVNQDTESGGTERIKADNTSALLKGNLRTLADILLSKAPDDDASISQLVDQNAAAAIEYLAKMKAISETQRKSAYDKRGEVTAEAKNDLRNILATAIFKGGSADLPDMYAKLPVRVQRALFATAFRDMDSPEEGRLLKEVQAAIIAFDRLMKDSPAFKNATQLDQIQRAVEAWRAQYQFDDAFNQVMPADDFSNFAVHLASIFKLGSYTQAQLTDLFNSMYDKVQGVVSSDLFVEHDTRRYSFPEIVEQVFGFKYEPAKNAKKYGKDGSVDVALGDRDGTKRSEGGEGAPGAGEPTAEGKRKADSGAGNHGDGRTEQEVSRRPDVADEGKPEPKVPGEDTDDPEAAKEYSAEDREEMLRTAGERLQQITLDFESEELEPTDVMARVNELQSTWEELSRVFGEEPEDDAAADMMNAVASELNRWRSKDVTVAEGGEGAPKPKNLDDVKKKAAEAAGLYARGDESAEVYDSTDLNVKIAAWKRAHKHYYEALGEYKTAKAAYRKAATEWCKKEGIDLSAQYTPEENRAIISRFEATEEGAKAAQVRAEADAKIKDAERENSIWHSVVYRKNHSYADAERSWHEDEARQSRNGSESAEEFDRGAKGVTAEGRLLGQQLGEMMKAAGMKVVMDGEKMRQELEAKGLSERMTVWHGSGAAFDAFDHSHMGEGEGNQVHGRGTYVAMNESTGKSYARALKKDGVTYKGEPIQYWTELPSGKRVDSPLKAIYDALAREGSKSKARAFIERMREMAEETEMKDHWSEVLDVLKGVKKSDFKQAGFFYEVEIPDDNGENYLYEGRTTQKKHRRRIADVVKGMEIPQKQIDRHGSNWLRGGVETLASVIEREQLDAAEIRQRLTDAFGSELVASEIMSKAGFVGIRYNGGIDGPCAVIFKEADAKIKSRTEFLRTREGEVYGFVKGDTVYLDPELMNPNTPLHEYTHLWARAVKVADPEFWARSKELMKELPLWEEVLKDEAYADIAGDEDLVGSEVLARLTGENGAAILDKMVEEAKRKGDAIDVAKAVTLRERVRSWLKDFCGWVRDAFSGKWDKKELDKLSVNELWRMPLRDFAKGMNPVAEMRRRGAETGGELERMFLGEKGAASADAAAETTVRMDNLKVAEEMEREFGKQEYSKEYIEGKLRDRDDILEEVLDEARKAYDRGFSVVGLRADSRNLKEGEKYGNSHQLFQDKDAFSYDPELDYPYMTEGPYKGYYDGGELNGTCAIHIDEEDTVKSLKRKIAMYPGEHVTLIFGDRYDWGDDDGEVIIEDAVVGKRIGLDAIDDARRIKLATGWERGADGKWRYEEPDEKEIINGLKRLTAEGDYPEGEMRLGDILGEESEIIKAYPELADTKVMFDREGMDGGGYDPETGAITLRTYAAERQPDSKDGYVFDVSNTLAHEVQHAIQHIEGFASGGNLRTAQVVANERIGALKERISQIRAMANEGKIDRESAVAEVVKLNKERAELENEYRVYKRLSGEVEARNVSERMRMSDEERRGSLAEDTEDVARQEQILLREGGGVNCSIVEEPELKARLERELRDGEKGKDYITLYRAARKIDGKYYSPKMTRLDGVGNEIVLGRAEQSDERPDLAYPVTLKNGAVKWKVDLDGGGKEFNKDGKGRDTGRVDYNPYIHCSDTPLNDQFKAAWDMPDMVVLEVRVPVSEVMSEAPYKADKAALSVGTHKWPGGHVDKQLPNEMKRKVYLSRYDLPVREVPVEECAKMIAEKMRKAEEVSGKKIHMAFNVFTPEMQHALRAEGVELDATPFGVKNARPAWEQSNGDLLYRRSDEDARAMRDAEIKRQEDKMLEIKAAAEAEGLTGLYVSKSVTPWGVSTYLQSQKYPGLKIRLSDHSVESTRRVITEIHVNNKSTEEVVREAKEVWDKLQDKALRDKALMDADRKRFDDADALWEKHKKEFEEKKFHRLERTYMDMEEFMRKHPEAELVMQKELPSNIYKDGETMRAYSYEWAAKSEGYYGAKKPSIEYIESMFGDADTNQPLQRRGQGRLTDAEVSLENDPISKVWGKSRFTPKQQKAFAERERGRMKTAVERVAKRLNLDNVMIVDNAEDWMPEDAKKAKGFFNKKTGEITIIVGNNASVEDIERTILHEGVAHYGLRKLFGEHFDNFLENAYEAATDDIRRSIEEIRDKDGVSLSVATEEFLGKVAETTDFEAHGKMQQWLVSVKRQFVKMLDGLGLHGFARRMRGTLNLNGMRYILWRSYENLRESRGEVISETERPAEMNNVAEPEGRREGESVIDYAARVADRSRAKEITDAGAEVDRLAEARRGDNLERLAPQDIQRNIRRLEEVRDQLEQQYNSDVSPSLDEAVTPLEEAAWSTMSRIDDEIRAWKELDITVTEGTNPDDLLFRRGDDEDNGRAWDMKADLRLSERVTRAKLALSANHAEDATLRQEALAQVGANLRQIQQATRVQREYDKGTIERVTGLVKTLMDAGMLTDMTGREIKSILSAVNGTTGAKDVKRHVDKVLDIMIGNQLRRAQGDVDALVAVRGKKINDKRIEVGTILDPWGQGMMSAFRKARGIKNSDDIRKRIKELDDKLTSDDVAVADAAAAEISGLQLAADYVDHIGGSKNREAELRRQLKDAKAADAIAEYGSAEAKRQAVAAIEDAIRNERAERVEAYTNFAGRLAGRMRLSAENAKDWAQERQQQANDIRHMANSDMQGRDATMFRDETAGDKVANAMAGTLLNPLMTFEQILRSITGKNAADGQSYTYNHFIRGLNNAREKEIARYRGLLAELDSKVAEVFDGNGPGRYISLMKWAERQKGLNISVWDKSKGDMTTLNLSQGNLMYIYMVDKMSDGRMKLRAMGVSEELVEEITNVLDPRLRALADWMQDDLLVRTRNVYNETHKRLYGANMAAIEHYFPLKVLGDARNIKEDVDSEDTVNSPTVTVAGALKARTVNKLALDLKGANALSVLLDHFAEMEHWNAFAELGEDMNTLLSYGRFRNQVKNMRTVYGAGEQLWKNLKTTSRIAFGTFHQEVGSVDKGVLKMAKGVTASKISLRINTAMKQLLSMPALIPELEVRNVWKSLKTPFVSFKWCYENLPVFRERWDSRMAGDPRLMKFGDGWKNWRSGIFQQCQKFGMSPNAAIDAFTCSVVAHSVYETKLRHYLRDGYEQEQAEQKAREDASITYNLSQQSNEGSYLSPIQAKRDLVSTTLTLFRNSPMSYTRQVVDSARGLSRNLEPGRKAQTIEYMVKQQLRDMGYDPETAPQDKIDAAKAAAERRFRRAIRRDLLRLATYGFILPGLWSAGGYWLYLACGANGDEKEQMIDDIVSRLATAPAEGLLGGDIIANTASSAITGQWSASTFSKGLPIGEDLESMYEKLRSDRQIEGAIDMVNVIASMGLATDLRTLENIALGIYGACSEDDDMAMSAAIAIGRILNCPPSQVKKLYFDEVDMQGEDAIKLTPAELARRYAVHQVIMDRAMLWGEDDVQKRAGQGRTIAKERMVSTTDETVEDNWQAFVDRRKELWALKQVQPKPDWRNNNDFARVYGDMETASHAMNAVANRYLDTTDRREAQELRRVINDWKARIGSAYASGDEWGFKREAQSIKRELRDLQRKWNF